MGWEAPKWIQNLFSKSDTGGSSEAPPIVYNKETKLPTVQSTVARSEWSAKKSETTSWVESGSTTSPPNVREKGYSGHPAGGEMRQNPQQYRRGWRTRNAERPTNTRPTLQRPAPERQRHQERPYQAPPGGGGGGGGRGEPPPYQERPYQGPPGGGGR